MSSWIFLNTCLYVMTILSGKLFFPCHKLVLKRFHNIEYLFVFFHQSVLKTFLHDPLVEWSKQAKGLCKTQANETGEIVNEKVCASFGFCLYAFRAASVSNIINKSENFGFIVSVSSYLSLPSLLG